MAVKGDKPNRNVFDSRQPNARQLHYGFSARHNECEFYCLLLHPMHLCTSSYIENDIVLPIISDTSLPYIFLDSSVKWQEKILLDIENIYLNRDKPNAPLYIQSTFWHILIELSENTLNINKRKVLDRNLSVLKDMLKFIQKNYAEKITLEDIAKSGNVSKSTCLSLFKKYLHDTPTNFLIGCRLKKSAKLLKEKEFSVTEIAYKVGFNGVSYFSETFRKNYGCSPIEYRKNI